MISAQIKKGNVFLIGSLEDHLLQVISLNPSCPAKPLKINYFNFIELLAEIINQYAKSKSGVSFDIFIVDYYVRKFEKSAELYRHFFGLTDAWKKYAQCHEDARLFLSLLTQQRNSRNIVKQFVKIRKVILKTISAKVLQEIAVTHSDALTICHLLFENEDRHKVAKKINTLFISLKRKMVNTAKINGAVACEFFLSAFEQLQQESHPFHKLKHLQNGTELSDKPVKAKQQDYELSFSEEYASRYGNEIGNDEQIRADRIDIEPINEHMQQEQVGASRGFDLEEARKSLHKLSRKDRDIDARLFGTGLIQWKNYPQGWHEFIKKNQIQKQKLLKGTRI